MCLACVQRPGRQATPSAGAADALLPWSAADSVRARIVYRQLPRWSRLLFDALSAPPARERGLAELRAAIQAGTCPFDVEDACGWAADYCRAVGRQFPVTCRAGRAGQPAYRMDAQAARLFAELAQTR